MPWWSVQILLIVLLRKPFRFIEEAVKVLPGGLAVLPSGSPTKRRSRGGSSEEPSAKMRADHGTRRVSTRLCRCFNTPVQPDKFKLVSSPSLMRNTSNFGTFAEPNNPTTNSLSFWLTARRHGLAGNGQYCGKAALSSLSGLAVGLPKSPRARRAVGTGGASGAEARKYSFKINGH